MDDEVKFQPIGRQSQDILNEAWTEAARVNPMLLAKLRPDYDFEKLKQRIRDRLDKGLSGTEFAFRSSMSSFVPPETAAPMSVSTISSPTRSARRVRRKQSALFLG